MKAKSTKPKSVRVTTKPTKTIRKDAAPKSAPKPVPKPAPKPAPKAAKPAVAAKAPRPKAAPEPKAKAAKPQAPLRPVPAPPKKLKPAQVAARRKDLDHFRALLLQKQRELMQAYAVTKGDSRSHLDNGTEDYIDYAVNSYAKEFLLSLTELDRKQLLLVEEALRRIDRGEFGRCQQCGEEINRKRLEVAPWARHCVRCQELEEQGLLPQYPFHQEETDIEVEKGIGADDEDYPADVETEEEPDLEDEALDTGDAEEEEE
jgi:DnaK suppressor protein